MNTHELTSWPCTLIEHDYNKSGDILNPAPIEDKASILFADPPYNIGYDYEDDPTGDNMSQQQYEDFTLNTLSCLLGAAKPGATLWWMVPEIHSDWIGDVLTRVIGPRLHRIVWHEKFAQYQGDRKLTHDYRFIFCHRVSTNNGEVTWNPDQIRCASDRLLMSTKKGRRSADKRANPAGRVPGTVWDEQSLLLDDLARHLQGRSVLDIRAALEFAREESDALGQVWDIRRLQGSSRDRCSWHPCQLPPELLTRIVRGWSNPGDTVVDAFAGSGSLGHVCRTLDRKFVGVDRSPTYIEHLREDLE